MMLLMELRLHREQGLFPSKDQLCNKNIQKMRQRPGQCTEYW